MGDVKKVLMNTFKTDNNSLRQARERNRYARLTPEQRQQKIQNVLHNRKRKRNGGCLFGNGATEQPFTSCSSNQNNRPSVSTGKQIQPTNFILI